MVPVSGTGIRVGAGGRIPACLILRAGSVIIPRKLTPSKDPMPTVSGLARK